MENNINYCCQLDENMPETTLEENKSQIVSEHKNFTFHTNLPKNCMSLFIYFPQSQNP